jgi:hypothetical protein
MVCGPEAAGYADRNAKEFQGTPTERCGEPDRSLTMGIELIEQAAACRKKAAECERRALIAQDEAYRRTYQELAQLWREMAQQTEMLTQRISRP